MSRFLDLMVAFQRVREASATDHSKFGDALMRLEEALEEYVDERIEKARSEAAAREFDARG